MRGLIMMVLAGCGRVGFGELGDARRVDGGDGLDAASASFTVPVPVLELDGPMEERDPTLTADLLEIYFTVFVAGDIWSATRSSATEPFGAPALVPTISTTAFEDTPEISPDGLTLYFSRGGTTASVYVATRATRADAWSAPAIVSELGTGSGARVGTLVDGDRKMYLQRGVFGATDLMTSTRPDLVSPWASPQLLTELDTSSDSADPAVAADDLSIVFSRDLGGQFDLMRARRASTDEPFDAPVVLSDLNSAADESDPWLSAQGEVVFFSSARDGTRRIYQATAR